VLLAQTSRTNAQGGLPAGVLTDVLLVADSTTDVVRKLEDRDGSGSIDPAAGNEVSTFYDDSSPGPDLSVPAHLAVDADGAVYLLDGGTVDAILRLEDGNADADANDAGEWATFYDASTGGPRLGTPNTLVFAPNGDLFVSDDGASARRILRLRDLDGNRNALGEGEHDVVYDASAVSIPVLTDIESLAVAADGRLFVGDSELQSVFVLEDVTGNGTFNDAGELRLFFRGEGDLAPTDLDALVISEGAVFVADEDTGRILKLLDVDGDGEARGEEVTVFLEANFPGGPSDLNDLIAAPGGGFYALDGSLDTVFWIGDLDGNGAADNETEVVSVLRDGGVTFATPSAIAVAAPSMIPLPGTFIRGEVTGDARVDLSDVIATLEHLFSGARRGRCADAMDADDTGDIDISDAVFSLNYQFVGGARPPPPFPEPGVDPTPDPLDC